MMLTGRSTPLIFEIRKFIVLILHRQLGLWSCWITKTNTKVFCMKGKKNIKRIRSSECQGLESYTGYK